MSGAEQGKLGSLPDADAVYAALETLVHAGHRQCQDIAVLRQRSKAVEQQAHEAVSSRTAMYKLERAIDHACSTRFGVDTVSRLSVHILYESEQYESAADLRVYNILFPEESDKIIGSWQQLHLHADILPFAVPGDVADNGEPCPICVQWDSQVPGSGYFARCRRVDHQDYRV